jgi:hypothetical protein
MYKKCMTRVTSHAGSHLSVIVIRVTGYKKITTSQPRVDVHGVNMKVTRVNIQYMLRLSLTSCMLVPDCV